MICKVKKILLIFVLCIFGLIAKAQTDTLNLGYCNGAIASSSNIQLVGTGWVESAVYLPTSVLKAYAGNAIKAVRAALVARINIDTLKVWIRSSLTGRNLAEGELTKVSSPAISKGWNVVNSDTAYALTSEGAGVYVGYSYHQKANVKATSIVGDAQLNTSFLKLGTSDWEDISSKGVLSIEAVVSGEHIPQYDLGLTQVRITPYPNAGENALKVFATIHNYGVQVPQGLTLTCISSGIVPIVTSVDSLITSTTSKTLSFVIDPKQATDESNQWTVFISGLNGESDEDSDNDSATAQYTFLKNVLVEEFSTEKCVNCPRVATYLHEALNAKSAYQNRVFALAHHAGYYTDQYTQSCDEKLTYLYNEGDELYAPAVMVDRQPYFSARYATGNATATFLPSSAENLESVFDSELEVTANAVVGVSLAFNADSTEVTATADCIRNDNYQASQPMLTLCLVEDNIPDDNQEGATGTYEQQHVLRAYNSTWGDAISWSDNRYHDVYTFSVDQSWKKQDLYVLAFIDNYDSSDPTLCTIENVAETKFQTDATTGIVGVSENSVQRVEVARYTVNGIRLKSPAKGLNLIKYSDGRVVKEMR